MKYLNVFLISTLMLTSAVHAQSSTDISTITNYSSLDWVEMEMIEGCLEIEVDSDSYQLANGIFQNVPTFRISLTEEQLQLNDNFKLSISDGKNTVVRGTLNNQNPSTPPITFKNVSIGVYTVSLYNLDNTYQCTMKISFKVVN